MVVSAPCRTGSPVKFQRSIARSRSTRVTSKPFTRGWENAPLVFHDQPLTDEQQLSFTRQFGDLERYETPGHIRKREPDRLGNGVADFSNLTRDGSLMSANDRIWLFKLGDRLRHSDSSFRPVTAGYSLLPARTVPLRGGAHRIRGHARRL